MDEGGAVAAVLEDSGEHAPRQLGMVLGVLAPGHVGPQAQADGGQ